MKSQEALCKIIKKSRVHFYKPIQIAEILFRNRTDDLELKSIESYRNPSKQWRDEISLKLVGRRSTSSQKYQDNLFESNAMPHEMLLELAKFNKNNNGIVEAYIYKSLEYKLRSVYKIHKYLNDCPIEKFSIKELLNLLSNDPGLRRSIDKAYEIAVHALFSTLVNALSLNVSVSIGNKDQHIMRDFDSFLKSVIGLSSSLTSVSFPANLYRSGVTNAADRGLDLISNFGPAIQVKHLSLSIELAEDIADNTASDKIVIVCLDAERDMIEQIMKQVGMTNKIHGIVTLSNLDHWYNMCVNARYRSSLGTSVINDLKEGFNAEFPSCEIIEPFIKTRGYYKIKLSNSWHIGEE